MKRLLLITVILTLFLCGCSAGNSITRESPEYIISSLGFDTDEENIIILMEAIVINSEDTSAEKKLIILEGKGETVSDAAKEAQTKAVLPLNFSHCGVIILGNGINREIFKEIFDYCYNKDQINLAAYFITAERTKALLSEKPIASISIGYDIMNRIESQKELSGEEYSNRFYQIAAEWEKRSPDFDIPLLKDGILSKNTNF